MARKLLTSFYSFERRFVGYRSLCDAALLSEAGDRVEVALSITDLSLDFGCTKKRLGPSSAARHTAGILRVSEKQNETVHQFRLPALDEISHHLVLQAIQSHSFFGWDGIRSGVIVVGVIEASDIIAAVLIGNILQLIFIKYQLHCNVCVNYFFYSTWLSIVFWGRASAIAIRQKQSKAYKAIFEDVMTAIVILSRELVCGSELKKVVGNKNLVRTLEQRKRGNFNLMRD